MHANATTDSAPLGIMAAMPEEIDVLVADMEGRITTSRAGRHFHRGQLFGHSVVLVFSRWGKVAAASTTTELILDHEVTGVVFFGIAGGLARVHRGDIVVATGLVQHDLDASPFFPPTHVPMLGASVMPTDPELSTQLAAAARIFSDGGLAAAPPELLTRAELGVPTVHTGLIASGDQVVFSDDARDRVTRRVPDALCVEMEGAAAAQVCFEHGKPFACVRTISDAADDRGDDHIRPFLEGLAGVYTRGIASAWLGARAAG